MIADYQIEGGDVEQSPDQIRERNDSPVDVEGGFDNTSYPQLPERPSCGKLVTNSEDPLSPEKKDTTEHSPRTARDTDGSDSEEDPEVYAAKCAEAQELVNAEKTHFQWSK